MGGELLVNGSNEVVVDDVGVALLLIVCFYLGNFHVS